MGKGMKKPTSSMIYSDTNSNKDPHVEYFDWMTR